MTEERWTPPKHPTHAEVREIIGAIISHIDQTPDWAPEKQVKLEPANEDWPGWQDPLTTERTRNTLPPCT
jgi:hypothetical protein